MKNKVNVSFLRNFPADDTFNCKGWVMIALAQYPSFTIGHTYNVKIKTDIISQRHKAAKE
ncbi:MAG: hypothetical protein WC637_01195 [Victivallales bacterium]|jgi:hypothetical protein